MSNTLRVLVAPDKFRGSLTAPEAAHAIERGILNAAPGAQVDLAPMADGGEGTMDALVAATGGQVSAPIRVTGPLGDPVDASYGILGDGRTAVIEMARASGLALISPEARDPLRATTRGTGELLRAALAAGAKRVIVGIGGSATNDGGAGMAQALGYRLLDATGSELGPGGGALARLHRIDPEPAFAGLGAVEIVVACDVDNPLCGERGASHVFGPQKGATSEMVEILARNLAHFAAVVERDLGVLIHDLPGAGAAGGLGGGLVAFAHGQLERGIEIVVHASHLQERIQSADLVLTGEGKFDSQSAAGKTVAGVARLAHKLGKPVYVIAGRIEPDAPPLLAHEVSAWFELCKDGMSVEESIAKAALLLESAAARAIARFRAEPRQG